MQTGCSMPSRATAVAHGGLVARGREAGGVHADDAQPGGGVALVPGLDVGQRPQRARAAEVPELDEDRPAALLVHPQRRDVDPGKARRERRRRDGVDRRPHRGAATVAPDREAPTYPVVHGFRSRAGTVAASPPARAWGSSWAPSRCSWRRSSSPRGGDDDESVSSGRRPGDHAGSATPRRQTTPRPLAASRSPRPQTQDAAGDRAAAHGPRQAAASRSAASRR